MIAVVNYDTGNIRSVTNALRRVGCTEWVYTDDKAVLSQADKVILPGVGEASSAMAKLAERGLDTFIPTLTQPVLGICVGTQLMCQSSEEGNVECMGIFRTKVKKFQNEVEQGDELSSFHFPLSTLKVPHMGWNQITDLRTPLFKDVDEATSTMCIPTTLSSAPTPLPRRSISMRSVEPWAAITSLVRSFTPRRAVP